MTPALTVHKDQAHGISEDIAQKIITRRKIAVQLQAAAKLHLEAARHYAAGDLGKAIQTTAMAQKHIALAQKN